MPRFGVHNMLSAYMWYVYVLTATTAKLRRPAPYNQKNAEEGGLVVQWCDDDSVQCEVSRHVISCNPQASLLIIIIFLRSQPQQRVYSILHVPVWKR